MGKLGTQCLKLKINNKTYSKGKRVYEELLKRLLYTLEFYDGNNICKVIESLSRMRFGVKY